MIIAIRKIIVWLGLWVSTVINLRIPTGINNGYITVKTLILFSFLISLAYSFIKIILTKGFNRNGGRFNGRDS